MSSGFQRGRADRRFNVFSYGMPRYREASGMERSRLPNPQTGKVREPCLS
jgi:hypothetical protein